MSQACSLRCKGADPESECNCSCEGQFHGEWFSGESHWANRVSTEKKVEDRNDTRSENEGK